MDNVYERSALIIQKSFRNYMKRINENNRNNNNNNIDLIKSNIRDER